MNARKSIASFSFLILLFKLIQVVRHGFSYYAKHLQDLQEIGQTTHQLAHSLGFSAIDAEQIATSLVEIGQYNLRSAPRILIQAGAINRGKTLKILVDNETGISDWLRHSLHEGRSSLNLPELGISIAPRFMDDLRIIAHDKHSATFVLKKHLPISENIVRYGQVSLAHQNDVTNGDSFLIKEYEGDKILVALIDGEGRGTSAAVLSTLVKEYLENNPSLPLKQLIEECHLLLKDRPIQGGVVMSLLRLTPGKIFYLGIGDTHTYVSNPHFRKLNNYSGKVGDYDLPLVEITTLPTSNLSRIVLCTDGIKEHIKAENLAANFSVQAVAENVHSSYRRINGDATAVVVDYQPFS